ncbi:hypothetical protein Pyn_03264 [Prunus yedoensis var. nudiflora]|uniref:Uncharacterized protein n=1 Tax=Prunus yedoensis var. nudiflora TaxID=2094558 RepID=A0A314ZNZ4_PRUYE|nr:hypothetical protein Pyn_03264 [Prunus yedoensis var. nudiflora]
MGPGNWYCRSSRLTICKRELSSVIVLNLSCILMSDMNQRCITGMCLDDQEKGGEEWGVGMPSKYRKTYLFLR